MQILLADSRRYWLWLCGWLLCGYGSLLAQSDTLFIEGGIEKMNLSGYFEALVDSQIPLALEQARLAEGYVPLDSLEMPLKLSHRLWARAWVQNRTSVHQTALFYLGPTDSAVVYVRSGDQEAVLRMGNLVAPKERSLPYGWSDEVKVELPPGVVTEIYVFLSEQNGVGPHISPRWEPYWKRISGYLMENLPYVVIVSLFCGGVLITLIYNLIVWLSLRTRAYLYYSLYLIAILVMVFFAMAGEMFQVLGFDSLRVNELLEALGLSSTALFYLLFGRSFLDTATHTPRWDRVLRIIIGIRLALMGLSLLAFFFPNGILTGLGNLVGIWFLVEMVSVLAFLVRVARLRTPVAWFFVMGSILVFGGGFGSLVVSSIFGIMDNNALGLLISLTLEIVVFSLGLGYKMRQQQKDKIAAEQALNQELQKINTAFGRFVPHAFLESLGHKSVLDVKLGDQVEKDVTVLFSDIRGYTTLAEGMTPQENFNFLNAYLGRMGPIIQANHGFVNQYYGDGIMALFMGEPADALRASIEMQQALAQYNALRKQKGRLPIQIGIGLHTGPLMMGIIGDTLRLEAGVVSDTVNTAARMEGLTKHFGVRLLLSESTESRLGDAQSFGLRLLGKVQVKGRQQPLQVYQAYDGETEAFRNLQTSISALFEAALRAYFEGNFAEAVGIWERVAQQAPDDLSTQHYLTQSRSYLQSGKPEAWEGVEVMQNK